MKQLTEQDIYERYIERAAIMQFEGGLSREAASQAVFNRVAAWCKREGIRFPQGWHDGKENVDANSSGHG